MKRPTIHLIVDSLAFGAVALMISSGLVLRYILPPGSGRLIGEGTGQGALHRPITLLWGLTRSEWSDFHYWVSLALMAILAVHLALHWKWIVCVIRNQPREGSGLRFALGLLGLLSLLAAVLLPFFSQTVSVPRYRVLNQSELSTEPVVPVRQPFPIRGSMTLREIENNTGIPSSVLLEALNVPAEISPDSQIGRLRKIYGFSMEDVHRVLDHYEEHENFSIQGE